MTKWDMCLAMTKWGMLLAKTGRVGGGVHRREGIPASLKQSSCHSPINRGFLHEKGCGSEDPQLYLIF